MKRVLTVVFSLAVLGGVVALSLTGGGERGIEVQAEAVGRRTIAARVKATGEVAPERQVTISAKVVGEIVELPVREGDEVEAGDLLVELEREVYEAQRDQARAALDQATAALRHLEAQVADAERALRRTRDLFDRGLATQEQLDTAELAATRARGELDIQRHAVRQSESSLRRTLDDLRRTTIRSPISGTVIELNAERGETVVPGTTNLQGSVIMKIAEMDRLRVEIDVSEVEIPAVALGQAAEVTVDALAGEKQRGQVVEIGVSGRKQEGIGVVRFPVKVALEEPHPALRPAMTAKVSVITTVREDALAVPIQAVLRKRLDEDGKVVPKERRGQYPDREVVFVATDGVARLRAVRIGVSDELHVEIAEGLSEGELVVVGPYRTLKDLDDGDRIRLDEDRRERKPDGAGRSGAP